MIKNMRKLLSLMSILGFSTVIVTNVVACTSADTVENMKQKRMDLLDIHQIIWKILLKILIIQLFQKMDE